MPIVDFKSSLVLSDVIATELSELPIVWEMWNIVMDDTNNFVKFDLFLHSNSPYLAAILYW